MQFFCVAFVGNVEQRVDFRRVEIGSQKIGAETVKSGNIGRGDFGERSAESPGIAPFIDLGDHRFHEFFFHLFGGEFRVGDGEDGIGVRFSL